MNRLDEIIVQVTSLLHAGSMSPNEVASITPGKHAICCAKKSWNTELM